jgi:hypothetical protein
MGELLDELLRFPQTRFNDQVDSISQYLWWRRQQQPTTDFEVDWGWDEQERQPRVYRASENCNNGAVGRPVCCGAILNLRLGGAFKVRDRLRR